MQMDRQGATCLMRHIRTSILIDTDDGLPSSLLPQAPQAAVDYVH